MLLVLTGWRRLEAPLLCLVPMDDAAARGSLYVVAHARSVRPSRGGRPASPQSVGAERDTWRHVRSRCWNASFLNARSLPYHTESARRAEGNTIMAVPAWIWFVEPVLKGLAESREPVSRRALVASAVERMHLSAEDLAEMAGATRYTKAEHRAAWALSYASMSGLVESPRRGHWCLAAPGRALLAAYPNGIPESELQKIARTRSASADDPGQILTLTPTDTPERAAVEATPEERIRAAHAELRESARADLLRNLRSVSPTRFEDIVLKLLHKVGYGGTRDQLLKTAGGADGGIDGIIALDRLGLDKVYVQAKRYAEDKAVSRPAIQGFLGALSERRASKGVFITTSRFTNEARESATRSSDSLVLIDGDMLAELMIDHGVGVSTRETFAIVQTDLEFFEDG